MTDLLLEARGIHKAYNGVPALIDGGIKLRPGTIHALCGGNGAGKSTFLNVLMGLVSRDGGEFLIDGKPAHFSTPAEALAAGITIITQELSLVDDLSVAENIQLGRESTRHGLVDYAAMRRHTEALMQRLGFDISARSRVGDLSVARKQLVEIARAISHDSRILIMDEPTSALGAGETKVLFEAIRGLKAQNVGIIYVSHRLRELFAIADDYTVFRNGRFVETGAMDDLDRNTLVRLIVGQDLHHHEPAIRAGQSRTKLKVSGLSRKGEFSGIDLQVATGEVLGIYGLVGAGRSEFLACLFGLNRPDSGEVELDGKPVSIASPRDALRHGLSLVTEDRKDSGIIACLSVRENIALSSLKWLGSMLWVRRGLERSAVRRMIDLLKVRTASTELSVERLSGGNQQKIVFARCLLNEPSVLLCDEPTRGVDEGAKQQIYGIIESFVAEGKASIVVSSEIDEILQVSDRIVVFRGGGIAGELSRAEASHEALTRMAA